jgi:hypothetical protein
MPCCTRHWWDEDVAAFKTELNALKNTTVDSDGNIADVGANVLAFLARKKEGVAAVTEVSPTCVNVKTSLIIVHSSMPSSVQRGRRTVMRIVALYYLMSGSNALKSR